MKILHLVNTLSVGGAELHLLTLCRHLKRLGVKLVVAYLKEGRGSRSLRSDFEAEGIRVLSPHSKQPWDGRYLMRAMKLVKNERPDLVHTHLPRADLVGFISRWLVPSVPWVCSVHGIYATHWSGRRTLPLFRWIWRQADRTIAISEAVKAWLVKDCRLLEKQVEVIHYGIEPERFMRPNLDLRKTWNLNEKPLIGSLGRLEPVKGFDLLIQAMPVVLRQIPHATLLIAGHDPWGYGRTLREIANQLGVHEQVRFVGFQDDVCSFLHMLDIFVLASRSEGFGQVVIEAMAAGKPVVVQRIPPLTEIVVHGETGLCVEPENPEALAGAIAWLLNHPQEAQQMGRRGRQRVHEMFSAERMAREIFRVYEQLLGGEFKKLSV